MSTHRDPGLQPERTVLAWTRTVLSTAVVAVLVFKSGVQTENMLLCANGLGLALSATVFLWLRCQRRMLCDHGHTSVMRAWPMALASMSVVAGAAGVLFTIALT